MAVNLAFSGFWVHNIIYRYTMAMLYGEPMRKGLLDHCMETEYDSIK